jgi:hypothetical protein
MVEHHDGPIRQTRLQHTATLGEPNDVPDKAINDCPISVREARPNLIPNLLAPIIEHLEARADALVWGHSECGANLLPELLVDRFSKRLRHDHCLA